MYCNHPEHVLTWNETEVDKMFRTFRKCGINISPDVEKNFQLMVSEAQIRYQTHRQLGEMHSAKVEDFVRWQYRRSEKREFKDPPATDAPDAQSLAKGWVEGFKQLDNWIGLHVETDTGMPLAFAIRTTNPDNGIFREEEYKSLEHEYARRTRMYDNAGRPYGWSGKVQRKMWHTLDKIFQGHPAYEYMRQFRNQPDGVGAYFSVRNHYLGPNNVNNMAAELEKDSDNLRYTQETSRRTFEKHVNKHEELHNVAQTLVPHGYGAADEGSRVRRLLAGIKTTTLDTIKGQVLGSPTLSKNFALTVSLFKDFIHQTKISSLATNSGSANVAGVASRDRRQRNGKGK
jgi:hypothetical protein